LRLERNRGSLQALTIFSTVISDLLLKSSAFKHCDTPRPDPGLNPGLNPVSLVACDTET
jgi:hypothetical protein